VIRSIDPLEVGLGSILGSTRVRPLPRMGGRGRHRWFTEASPPREPELLRRSLYP